MATLATQVIALTGLNPTYAAATGGGDKCEVGDRNFLHVKNGSGSPITVTLTATAAVRGQSVSNVTVSVPASGERMIGPLSSDLLRNASDGLCAVGYSSATTVTVASVRL
ncbi:hypothetical protein [Streptomyces sp. NBC_00847]|uniref:hypothetical protein n=1 Tax=Streptomyces sp. NBC_00847 TaxID=2975850 RepID=UPI00225E609D|nr:hypothetical protein [Streptomyces sp. NBC_00847]MCX4886041.1 hypothetical protein [Streptomyces sp. NBC_00847]